jgi:hypothetical protein
MAEIKVARKKRPANLGIMVAPLLAVILSISFTEGPVRASRTGLTLKFSDTKWAEVFSHPLGGFESAGCIHRGAAVAET